MAEWAWVAAGYSLVYGSMIAYAGWLARRIRRARRDITEGVTR